MSTEDELLVSSQPESLLFEVRLLTLTGLPFANFPVPPNF